MNEHTNASVRRGYAMMAAVVTIGCRADVGTSENAPPDRFADCSHPAVVEACTDGWCRIPAGCFVMGSPEDEWGRGAHTEEQMAVTLTRPFAIMQHEVTQAEWTGVGVPLPPSHTASPGDCSDPSCPVRHLTWFEGAAYANARSALHEPPLAPCYQLEVCSGGLGEGMTCEKAELAAPTVYACEGYRLPTEAEWEYAARAGTRTAFFSGGIQGQPEAGTCLPEPNLEEIAWYCSNSEETTHPTGQKRANGWGLYDVLGNVPEWTNDYSEAAQPPGPLVDPAGEMEQVPARVTKGGSAFLWSSALRAGSRLRAIASS